MKRILFFLLFCAIIFSGFSKSYLLQPPNWFTDGSSDQAATMLTGGYFQGNFSLLNNYVHQFGSASFSPFYQTVGIDIVLPTGTRTGQWNSTIINAEMILPQKINEGDSIKFRMSGWHFITSFYSRDLIANNEKLALEIAPGMDWGQLYIKTTDKIGQHDYSNPFIAPLIRTEFRVVLAPFAFGIRASYRYDISSPRWKYHLDNSSGLAHSRISGFGFQVFVGWGKTVN